MPRLEPLATILLAGRAIDGSAREASQTLDNEISARNLSAAEIGCAIADAFRNCRTYAANQSDNLLAEALEDLVFAGRSNILHNVLNDNAVNIHIREECILSTETVFLDVFSLRCDNKIYAPGATKLEWVCYMWWDLFPELDGSLGKTAKLLKSTVAETIRRVLQIQHAACQESALHGMLDWFPVQAKAVRNRLLDSASKTIYANSQVKETADSLIRNLSVLGAKKK